LKETQETQEETVVIQGFFRYGYAEQRFTSKQCCTALPRFITKLSSTCELRITVMHHFITKQCFTKFTATNTESY
jgi:hypothetical protein